MSRPRFRRFVLVAVALSATLAGPALLGATAITAAQTSEPGTLTVTGFGSASAPAETTQIQVLVSPADFFGAAPTELVGTPAPDQSLTSPVVEALRAADVPDDAVQVITSPALASSFGPGGPGVARLDITLEAADLGRVNEVLDAAGTGASEAGLIIIGIGVDHDIADCSGLTRDARDAAITDAEAQADVQAELLGLTRGSVIASEDALVSSGLFLSAIPEATACPGEPGVDFLSPGLSLREFNPVAPAEVQVFAAVNLTFAIEA